MMHWLLHVTGGDNGSGSYYLEWSGIVGDASIFAAMVAFILHRQCHVKRCWRRGRHPHGPYNLCSKHHPLVPDGGPEEHHITEAEGAPA